VHDAALVGIHRLELERTSGCPDTLGQTTNALHDPIFTHRAIHLAIDHNFRCVFVFRLQKPVEQKLERFQCFAVASNQAAAFLGINLQDQIARLVLRFFDLHDEAEIAKNRVE